jgi:hypothetical protein
MNEKYLRLNLTGENCVLNHENLQATGRRNKVCAAYRYFATKTNGRVIALLLHRQSLSSSHQGKEKPKRSLDQLVVD